MQKRLFFGISVFFIFNTFTYYSQFRQDEYVYLNFFKHKKKKGIFVDIGAHDGISLSNTYFFEKELGWTGICIEPIPEIFEKLKKNRSCICLHGAISDKVCNEAPFFVTACPELTNQGFFPEMLSKLVDMQTAHELMLKQDITENNTGRLITVRCYILSDILEKYNINYIDYLSIDTEGSELDILKTIDFNKIFIDIIDVENNHPEDNRIRMFLESKGYRFVSRITCDEIYQCMKKIN